MRQFKNDPFMTRPFWLTPALLLLCSTAPSWAQTQDAYEINDSGAKAEDTFKVNASETLMTDSNLFRLPDGASEKINMTALGLSFNKTYSLQRFELDLNLIDYRYQNFSNLDFTAKNVKAAWRWSLTPSLTGNFTTDRKDTLNTFETYTDLTQGNKRTNTNTRFDGAYELGGALAVLGGVSKAAQTNEQASAEVGFSSNSADLGVRYTFASGNTLTYTLKDTSGTYQDKLLSLVNLADNSYKQIDNEIKMHWLITAKSTADLTAAYVNRTHPNGEGDFSGLTSGANLNWRMTEKTSLSARWSRELARYLTIGATYSQTDSFSIGPTWQVSPKTVVRLNYQTAQRDYLGAPAGVAASQRSDTLTDMILSVDWQPYRSLTVSTALQKSRRTSNEASANFDSNMATVAAKFSF